jgi:ribosome-associated heat shock protein Hsp15
MSEAPAGRMRLDKWLWCARFFKSRARASRFCEETGPRVNGAPVTKPHHGVKPGDVLTLAVGDVRVVRIVALPTRRGPAPEARACYEIIAPAAQSVDGDMASA